MNPAERFVEHIVGYPIDWDATGTWVGALMTAIAVFWAATLAESAQRRAAKNLRRQRYRALAALYREAAKLLRSVAEGEPLPALDQVDDLLSAVNAAPVLELGNEAAILQFFQVKNCLISVREAILEFDPMTWTEAMSEACEADAKLCDKIAEAGRHAARIGHWPKPIGNGWVVLSED